jgi:SAM-dependent methyltransferase
MVGLRLRADHEGHERRYHGGADRLRAPERVALLELERVVQLSLEGLSARRVLEVGTGTAVFAEAFASRGCAVAGIDADLGFLQVAAQHVPSAQFVQAAAEALPYCDRAFDVAFFGHVLHEADDPMAALREAQRVAALRVVVLEWPCIREDRGPPFEHRLHPDAILAMAKEADCGLVEQLPLTHMHLYRMSVRH